MKTLAALTILVLLLAPVQLAAQDVNHHSREIAAIGAFAGAGSGPIEAAAWGIEFQVPIWRTFELAAEFSGWGNGLGETMCITVVPESHRCSVSGWAGLAGLGITVPANDRLAAFGQISGGGFSRDWLGEERVNSAALSMKAGIAVGVYGPLQARFAGRLLRVFDNDYQSLLGEDLQYLMGTVGLSYRLGW